MLTTADLKKMQKLLAPLATKKDVGGAKNLASLWEKYAKVVIKLDRHERLIKELQKKGGSEAEEPPTIVGMNIIKEYDVKPADKELSS